MVLSIVSNSKESQRRTALRGFGLALRELATHTMLLSAQRGDALDFHSAFSQVVEKIKSWPDGQLLPTSDELRQELSFHDGQPNGEEHGVLDATSENLEQVSARALSYVAAIYQGVIPQIWTQKRSMLEACAELVRAQNSDCFSTETSVGKKRRLRLSQPMRSALDYFLSDHPIRRAIKLTPKRSTIRALNRRKMLERTGNGLLDYKTNASGRIEFVGAHSQPPS